MNEKDSVRDKGYIKWIFSQVGDKKPRLIGSVFVAIISVFCGLIPYFIVAQVIEDLINGEKDFKRFVIYAAYMMLAFLGKAVFHAISTSMSHGVAFAINANIRKQATDKLVKMPLGDVMAFQPGALKSTIMERVDALETTVAHLIPEYTSNIGAPFIILIAIFALNWKMGLAALATIPVGAVCMMLMMCVGYEEHYTRVLKGIKELNNVTMEYIGGIQVIKAFSKSESSYKKFSDAAYEAAQSNVDWMKDCNIFMTIGMSVMPASMVTVLPIGAIMYMNGHIEITTLITIIVYTVSVIEPLIAIASQNDDLAMAGLIVKEVRKILDAPEMQRPDVLLEENVPKDNSVVFENVHFSYQDKEVLHGIDIKIKEGEYVALVGPSGSGKSTLARLLASLWDVKEGSISIGGVDLKQLPLEECADRVAYVSQENYLFNLSVMDNIRMGRKNSSATDEEVIEVAKLSGCHDFIMGLENGYDTIVGSAGGHLSGGERQRITIARAMLKDAPIVILDEATAYTDPESEAVIQKAVSKLVKGKTLVVIAHRLSTVCDADRIYVINDGKVEEDGTHAELLEKNGLYKSMWSSHLAAKDYDMEVAQ